MSAATSKNRRAYVKPAIYKPSGKIPPPEDPNLPEEARKLLYTIDNLPIGGGVESSMWYGSKEIFEAGMKAMGDKIEKNRLAREREGTGSTSGNASTANLLTPGDGLQSSVWAASTIFIQTKPPSLVPRTPQRQLTHQPSEAQPTASNLAHKEDNMSTDYIPPHLRSTQKPNDYVPPHLRTGSAEVNSRSATLRSNHASHLSSSNSDTKIGNYGSKAIIPDGRENDPESKLASSWEDFAKRSTSLGSWKPKAYTALKHGEKVTVDRKLLTVDPPEIDQDLHATQDMSHRLKSPEIASIEQIDAERLHEQSHITSLTRTAPIATTGASAPPESSEKGISAMDVSDTGIEGSAEACKRIAGDVRGSLAPIADDLQDPDGSWAPPPIWVDRELDTPAYIPDFIKAWRQEVPGGDQKIDINNPKFANGEAGVNNYEVIEPVEHPLCFPDLENSENPGKQSIQTALLSSQRAIHKSAKNKKHRQLFAAQEAERFQLIANNAPAIIASNPNTPRTKAYLRPAEAKDIPGITNIYNYYVMNTNVPEDQERVPEEAIRRLWEESHAKGYVFIVAIFGDVPLSRGRNKKEEMVIGFAYAEGWYGLGGGIGGRSRHTAALRFYVHIDYTRKGIGLCLVDRLLHCMGSLCALKGGHDWINPGDNPVYQDMGGNGPLHFHQVIVERAIDSKTENSDSVWLKEWLKQRFGFKEASRQLGVGRSAPRGCDAARWMDLITFQLTINVEDVFPNFK